jgi:hypothetical protein
MRRLVAILVPIVATFAVTYGQSNVSNTQIQSSPSQYQNTQAIGGGNADSTSTSTSGAIAEGGSSDSWSYSEGGWSDSWAAVSINTTSISNYKSRVPPVSTYPPYLPVWNHGGWGTINAYFSNGPTNSDRVYERTFDTANPDDVQELKGIVRSLPYSGPLQMVGGLFNGLFTLFGAPDRTHHGRGIEIANGVIRDRRPKGKPLLVFIDSNVDGKLLEEAGYAYVGRISLEGNPKRNWDQVYNAAVAEALPWDIDILLVSGGMKGVTVGSNTTLPSAAGGYAQVNYSLSLLGGHAKGITEGKGEAMISASAYRYCPEMLQRRKIPAVLYERIRVRPKTAAAAGGTGATGTPSIPTAAPKAAPTVTPAGATATETVEQPNRSPVAGVDVSRELYNMAGLSAPPASDPAMR